MDDIVALIAARAPKPANAALTKRRKSLGNGRLAPKPNGEATEAAEYEA